MFCASKKNIEFCTEVQGEKGVSDVTILEMYVFGSISYIDRILHSPKAHLISFRAMAVGKQGRRSCSSESTSRYVCKHIYIAS